MYTDANPMTAARRRWGRRTALLSAGRRMVAACVLLSLSVVPGGSQTRTAPAATPVQAAIRALGQFEDANSHLREAAELAPDDVMMNTAWGELFLEKYNKQDATKSFQAALRADEEWVPARIGLARTVLDENPPMARSLIE